MSCLPTPFFHLYIYLYMYYFLQIFEVYNFQKSSSDLFKPYIDEFLKIKQESSGWPTDCLTDEQRKEYIANYEKHEGVKLNITEIKKNPGRRQVAKLALNCFWGRYLLFYIIHCPLFIVYFMIIIICLYICLFICL